jgi:hypothetical protein
MAQNPWAVGPTGANWGGFTANKQPMQSSFLGGSPFPTSPGSPYATNNGTSYDSYGNNMTNPAAQGQAYQSAYDTNHGAGEYDRRMGMLSSFGGGASMQPDGTYGVPGQQRMTQEQMTAGRATQTYGDSTVGAGMGQQNMTPDGFNAAASPGGFGGMAPGLQGGGMPGTGGAMERQPATGGGMPGTGGAMERNPGAGGMAGTGGYGGNPYLSQMADEIGRRSNEGLQRGLQGIRSNAVGVGGLGGSRQGVAEGAAIGASQDSLQGQLAGLYGGQYNQDANRWLQQYGMDQGYDVSKEGLRNQFFLGNRGQDIQSVAVGGDLVSKGMQGPWNSIQAANSVYSPYANGGNGTTDGGNSGSNWQSILGGLGQGAQFAKGMGWL